MDTSFAAAPAFDGDSDEYETGEALQIERRTGQHVFDSLAVVRYPGSIEAEAIRGLRTRIMAQHVREGRRSLAICSPSEGSGCTFVAANLAIALGQIGVKTVLVDADLRFPAVAPLLGIDGNEPGLAEYLTDRQAHVDDFVLGPVAPSLWVVPAGAVPGNPQELLSGDRFREFVDSLLREFDMAIFDTTAANRCTDAQRVATLASYSLIVARKHKSYVNDVAMLAKQLRADRSTVIGTVLNEF